MKIGDLVQVTRPTSGGGRARRAVHIGELGVLLQTHYISNLSSSTRLWCDVMMSDGMITLPDWCISGASEDETR